MTEKQRKLLFLLAKQKGMDNEILHSYVEAKTGKQSITEVTTQEAKVLLDGLQEKKQTAKGHITEKQLHYMKGLAKNLGWNEKTLNQFIEKQYGISNVHWLSSKQAAKVIEGLKNIQEKKHTGDKSHKYLTFTKNKTKEVLDKIKEMGLTLQEED